MSSVSASHGAISLSTSVTRDTAHFDLSTKAGHGGLGALGRGSRRILLLMFVWAFLHPALHYYLGKISVLSGNINLSMAGLVDVSVFGLEFLVILGTVGKRDIKPMLFWPSMFYLASVTYAWLVSPVKEVAARQIVAVIGPLLFYLSVAMLARNHDLSRTVARVIVLSSVLPMVVGVLQIFSQGVPAVKDILLALPVPEGGLDPYSGLTVLRVSGPTWQYNQFAVFLGLLLLAVILQLYDFRSRDRRWLWLIVAAALFLGTLMRGVWLGFFVALVPLFLMAGTPKRILVGILGCLIIPLILLTPLNEILDARLADTQTIVNRGELYDLGWQLFVANPFGYGLGTSAIFTLQAFDWVPVMSQQGGIQLGFIFHNEYITSAVEGGVFQLCAHIFLLICLIAFAVRDVKLARVLRRDPKWGIWLLCATVLVIISGFSSIGLTADNFVFWGLVAGTEMEYRSMLSQPNDSGNADVTCTHAQKAV